MTSKHREFLRLMASGLSERKAALKVWSGGYARQKRYRHNPLVVEEMQKIHDAYINESQVSRKDVVDGILTAINHAQLTADPAAQIKGWTELAKLHGYYEPEKKITEHVVKIEKRLEETPTDKLIELAGAEVISLDKMDWTLEAVEVEAEEVEDGG